MYIYNNDLTSKTVPNVERKSSKGVKFESLLKLRTIDQVDYQHLRVGITNQDLYKGYRETLPSIKMNRIKTRLFNEKIG